MSRHIVGTNAFVIGSLFLSLMLRATMIIAEDAPAKKDDPFAKTFSTVDKDGDQRLSLKEFEDFRGQSPVTRRDFRLFDQNRDGFLVRDEFATIPDVVDGVERESRFDPVIALSNQVVANLDKALGKWNEQPNVELEANRFQDVLMALLGPNLPFNAEETDEDRNGSVSRAEARRFVEILLGIRRGDGQPLRLHDGRLVNYGLFIHNDINKNGRIERKEFFERSPSPNDAGKEFDSANKDGDNDLTFEEFKNLPGRGVFDSVDEFRKWDTNLDALISKDELFAGTPNWQKKVAANSFPAFDLDKDGQLSLAEYQLTPQTNMVLPWDWGIDDKDGNGSLSFSEFVLAPTKIPQYEWMQFPLLRFTYFHRLDQNSDGKLDSNEFHFQGKIPNEFFVLNEDGTGWKSLFLFKGRNANGSVSVAPNGKSIAFDSWPGASLRESEIYIKDLEGGEPRMVCKGLMPTWSKDGRFLTCSRYEPVRGVWLIEVDGIERERLCPGWGAQWSPDGRQIAFGEGPIVKIFDILKDEFQTVLDREDSPYQRIFFNMTWSPDSQRLCLKGVKADGTEEIATLRSVDGKPHLKIHHSGTVEVHPDFAWHPKGDRIACALFCPDRGVTQLYEFNPDKDDPPQLMKGQDETRNNTDITWTPDGKRLIVVSGDF